MKYLRQTTCEEKMFLWLTVLGAESPSSITVDFGKRLMVDGRANVEEAEMG